MDFYELNEKMNEEYKPSQHFIDRAGDAYTQYVNQPIEDWLDSQGYLKKFIMHQFDINDIEDVKSVYDKISGYQQYMGGMHDWLEMFDKLKRHLKELKARIALRRAYVPGDAINPVTGEPYPRRGGTWMKKVIDKERRKTVRRDPNQTMRPDREEPRSR